MIITIKNLRVGTVIGVHEWEQKQTRELILTLRFSYDGSQAAETDDVTHVVDYSGLEHALREFIAGRRWKLIEALAQDAAEFILQHDKRIDKVTLEVDKHHAMRFADSVSATAEAVRKA